MYKTGAIPSAHDPRDRDFHISSYSDLCKPLPDAYEVPGLFPIYDQSDSEMCVAFSLCQCLETDKFKTLPRTRLSPLWIYGNRSSFDYQGEGMDLRSALRALLLDGTPPWDSLPGIGTFKYAFDSVTQLKQTLLPVAKRFTIDNFSRLYQTFEVKHALMDFGPVPFCMGLTTEFSKLNKDNPVYLDKSTDLDGFHCMTIVGWETINTVPCWKVVNSWGTDWGVEGIGYVPIGIPNISECWALISLKEEKNAT